MRKYTLCGGPEVDLDDPKTYMDMPKSIKECNNRLFQEIGYMYLYTNYWNKDIFFSGREYTENQMKRIDEFIINFNKNSMKNTNNLLWWQEQLFLFLDEIENMV